MIWVKIAWQGAVLLIGVFIVGFPSVFHFINQNLVEVLVVLRL